jgi:hypothetical protein
MKMYGIKHKDFGLLGVDAYSYPDSPEIDFVFSIAKDKILGLLMIVQQHQ